MDISICAINKEEKKIEYAGANRPLYVVLNGSLSEIKADKVAIGGFFHDEEKTFHLHTIDAQPGAVFYLSSDGYADQFNPTDRKMMTKRFKEYLVHVSGQALANQRDSLIRFHEDWKLTAEQTDDVLVIGFKI
jgi:serine phosphatase RsbU (regulator of sigma subunit)